MDEVLLVLQPGANILTLRRADLDPKGDPAHRFGNEQRGAEAGERVQHGITFPGVLAEEVLDQALWVADIPGAKIRRQLGLFFVPQQKVALHGKCLSRQEGSSASRNPAQ